MNFNKISRNHQAPPDYTDSSVSTFKSYSSFVDYSLE